MTGRRAASGRVCGSGQGSGGRGIGNGGPGDSDGNDNGAPGANDGSGGRGSNGQGRQIFPLGVDADPRIHRTRGYSPGGFGTYPTTPTVVRIAGNLIDYPKALRNLLAIIRMFWPNGCVGVKDVDRKSPNFWDDCIDEFLNYYTWDPKFATKDEARASILAVLRDRLRCALADDKKRADKQIKAGGTYLQHMPLCMKPGVWSRIAEYWSSEGFKKKSAAGQKTRKVVKLPHTSGARSFDRRHRDYVQKHGKPNTLVVYKDCHTLKNKDKLGQWITEATKDFIVQQFLVNNGRVEHFKSSKEETKKRRKGLEDHFGEENAVQVDARPRKRAKNPLATAAAVSAVKGNSKSKPLECNLGKDCCKGVSRFG
ncbi:hypothetical protein POM88_023816 [Heracleum sosnowskyi]|uniref:Transposase n=1 Tax=Heracleum sosnowskyi TaxID=360622 RepID=A0AAD8IJK7_9APIA|nr:hypothetical protein POM88_023816 [Heracleum sosnowskyi]